MSERPILFSGPMVRAILEGRKTQTRRVVNPRWPEGFVLHEGEGCVSVKIDGEIVECGILRSDDGDGVDERWQYHDCPYGYANQILWVRETWSLLGRYGTGYEVAWRASSEINADGKLVCEGTRVVDLGFEGPSPKWDAIIHELPKKWRPSMFMPRWASRISLKVTGVRVERVQDISEADARAEGISVLPLQSESDPSAWYQSEPGVHQGRSARASYAMLWDAINAKRGYSWESNPWVWVLEFERMNRGAQ